jgi:hypothetical protein
VLFQGDSCFPFSPKIEKESNSIFSQVSENDQLVKILEVTGAPKPADIEFIQNESTCIYIKELYKNNIENQPKRQKHKSKVLTFKNNSLEELTMNLL